MSGNKTLCSIKGCKYKGSWKMIIPDDKREYRICPKHKHLIVNPFNWSKIE